MYTHIVKRQSGYIAGWLKSKAGAEAFAAECNSVYPADPAHVEYLDPSAWDAFLEDKKNLQRAALP